MSNINGLTFSVLATSRKSLSNWRIAFYTAISTVFSLAIFKFRTVLNFSSILSMMYFSLADVTHDSLKS